jgi:hypothetical protein
MVPLRRRGMTIKELIEDLVEVAGLVGENAEVTIAYLNTTHHLSEIEMVRSGKARPFMQKERKPVVILEMGENVWNDDEDLELDT